MARRTFVDSLFVIALVNQRDQYHRQALTLAASLRGEPLLTTDAILLEVGNGLARSHKKEAVGILGVQSALTFDRHFRQAGFKTLMQEIEPT